MEYCFRERVCIVLGHPANRTEEIFIAPTLRQLQENEKSISSENCDRPPSLTIREFAHLCAVLTQNKEIRSALIDCFTNLTRAQQDCRQSRDEFCEYLMAPEFKTY